MKNANLQRSLFRFMKLGFVVLLVIQCFYVAVGALRYPVHHIDVWSHWFYKPELLSVCKPTIQELKTKSDMFLINVPEYPLFSTVIYFVFRVLLPDPQYALISLIGPIMYVIVLVVAGFTLLNIFRMQQVEKRYRSVFTLASVYFYSMFGPLLAQGGRLHAGMVDIWLTLGYWLILFISVTGRRAFATLWVLAAILPQIKREGVLVVLLFLFLPFFSGKMTPLQRIILMMITLGSYLIWQVVFGLTGIDSTVSMLLYSIPEIGARAWGMVLEVSKELLNFKNWYLFWVVFAISGFRFDMVPKKNNKTSLLFRLNTIFFLFLMSVVVIYLSSSIPIQGYLESTFDRLLLQVSPIWFSIFLLRILRIFRPITHDLLLTDVRQAKAREVGVVSQTPPIPQNPSPDNLPLLVDES